MKKLFLAGAFLLGITAASQAQPGQGGQQLSTEERVKMQMSRFPEGLNLTADQSLKVQAILTGQAKSQDSLMAAARASGDGRAAFGKLQPIREANDQKILALLNEDQKKIFSAYLKERANRGPGGGQGGNRPGGGQGGNRPPREGNNN
jgi:periplasmic protein CpxP/Spy